MQPIRQWTSVCVLTAATCLGCASVPSPTNPAGAAPAAATAAAPAAAPAAKCSTLPEFLGLCDLNRCAATQIQRLGSCLGMQYPGLEGKPPLLPITDPANAKSPDAAVSSAAKIKEKEDGADQKIKALRYLAGIGCLNCYPGVEEAFLKALADCTEAVRYEAIQALRKAAGCPCQNCRHDCCCTPAIQKRLNELASGTDEKTGCYKESSPRVRRVARLALKNCSPPPPEEKEPRPAKKSKETHRELPVEKHRELPADNAPLPQPGSAHPAKDAEKLEGAAGKSKLPLPPPTPPAS
jgi:hypothetical protein